MSVYRYKRKFAKYKMPYLAFIQMTSSIFSKKESWDAMLLC